MELFISYIRATYDITPTPVTAWTMKSAFNFRLYAE